MLGRNLQRQGEGREGSRCWKSPETYMSALKPYLRGVGEHRAGRWAWERGAAQRWVWEGGAARRKGKGFLLSKPSPCHILSTQHIIKEET